MKKATVGRRRRRRPLDIETAVGVDWGVGKAQTCVAVIDSRQPNLLFRDELLRRVAESESADALRGALDAMHEVQWDGSQHVRIRRRDGKPVVLPWDHLQRLIHESAGPEACAVEVFPPLDDVVDEANMRHFWLVEPDDLMRVGAWLRSMRRDRFVARGRKLMEEG